MAVSPRGGIHRLCQMQGWPYTGKRTIGPKAWWKPEMTSRTPKKKWGQDQPYRAKRAIWPESADGLTNFLLCKPRQSPTVIEYSPSCPLSSTITSREIVEPAAEEVVYSIVYSWDKISEIVEYTVSRSEELGE